mmetsp:Transcript_66440/g.74433  ORF Transcript_66440/g.74433 Transcript_66440/m.74433 type:complete len:97 (+) Transcript_66440:559-849(+)
MNSKFFFIIMLPLSIPLAYIFYCCASLSFFVASTHTHTQACDSSARENDEKSIRKKEVSIRNERDNPLLQSKEEDDDAMRLPQNSFSQFNYYYNQY